MYVGLQRNQEQHFSTDIIDLLQFQFQVNQNAQVDVNSCFRPIALTLYAAKVFMNVFVSGVFLNTYKFGNKRTIDTKEYTDMTAIY